MGQKEVYEVLKADGGWLLSKEIIDGLEYSIGAGNLSRNLLRLRQVGMVKTKHIERNTFMYRVI